MLAFTNDVKHILLSPLLIKDPKKLACEKEDNVAMNGSDKECR